MPIKKKKTVTWYSTEVTDALITVPKLEGVKDTSHLPELFFKSQYSN